MIRIPVYLAVAQWAMLAALGALVAVMFRQLGRVLTGPGRAPELGPPVGGLATALTYVSPGSQVREQLTPGAGEPLLLAFVDPTCPSCEQLVAVLHRLQTAGELAGLRPLLLISDPPSYLQISEAFSVTAIEIGRLASRDGLDFYRATATPLLVAIDAAGVVRASGSVIGEDEVRGYVRACVAAPPAAALAVMPGPVRRATGGREYPVGG
jgi:hypothetical protein